MPEEVDAEVHPSPALPGHAKDWYGDDDTGNPRNWSLLRSISSTIAVTTLAFVSTLGASIYAPGIDEVAREFNVSTTVAILPLSLYTQGLAFGPLVGAPLCETYGRKVLFLATTPIFALFVLGSGLSQSISSLIVCRFFAGVFASPAISNASATIIDYSGAKNRAVPLSFYYSIPFFGAVFGPLIGGYLVYYKSWRWTQWTILMFIAVFYIPIFLIRESYKKTILQRRAKTLQIEGPPSEEQSLVDATRRFLTVTIVRPVRMLFTEPIVSLVCLYSAFQFGLMYSFVVASPYIFSTVYNFDLRAQSLSFLGFMIGTLIAPLPLILVDRFIYQPRLRRFQQSQPTTSTQPSSSTTNPATPSSSSSQFPPEHRLYASFPASLTLPLTLLLFAWLTTHTHPAILPIILQALIILSSLLIYAPANLYMMDTYGPLFGASASGANMLSRYTLSAVFPLFTLPMYRGLGVGWATTLLALVAVGMGPIPWVFWRLGAKLRRRGRYETSL